ncbi:MAG: 2-oxoglutarate and iron-dependent oxygenase domain-containing protein [Pseudomonadota bacterium]
MPDTIPIIDLTPLTDGSPGGVAKVGREIGAACRGIGFFAITGHGVPETLRENVFAASADFFHADQATKDAVKFSPDSGNRGYIPMKGEALNPDQPPDLKEAFNIGLDLDADDPEIVAGAMFRAVNLWPDVPGFRDTMVEYFDAMLGLGQRLHRAISADLGLPLDHFHDKLDRPLATLRLLHYPPLPNTAETGQLGAGEHTDYGNITILATDTAGGLEVRTRNGDWLKAPVLPGGYICNIGDCLMRWTNNVYVSTPHRVVNPVGRERASVAFFLDPNPDAIVECLPTCIGDGAKYPSIRGDDYLLSKLNPTYEKSGLM